MAKYTGSVYGKVSGTAAGVVGSNWKGIPYIRAYAIPANPETSKRRAQKNSFKHMSQFGRRIVDTILNPYTLPAPKRMSAFNKFVSDNTKKAAQATTDYSLIKIVEGSLYNPGITTMVVISETTITVTWSVSKIGEAADSDIVKLVFYDKNEDKFEFDSSTRSEGTKVHTTSFAFGADDHVHGYILFADAALTKTSDSSYKEAHPVG